MPCVSNIEGFIISILLGYILGRFSLKRKPQQYNMDLECPHGYQNWDHCPDCRH